MITDIPVATNKDIDDAVAEWKRVTGDPCGSINNPCYYDCIHAANAVRDHMEFAMPFINRLLAARDITVGTAWQPVKIVAAAIIFDTTCWTLPPPARHHDIINLRYKTTGLRGSGLQGFIDSTGQFLTREEAMIVAKEANQLIPRKTRSESEDTLYSEDLW